MINPTSLYVARIEAISIEAYTYYVNENPPYINAIFNWVDKPYNLRGGPLQSNLKLMLHILDGILSHTRPRIFGILFAYVAAVFYFIHTMVDSYILKDFYLFYRCMLLITDESWRVIYICALYVSSHFHLYHTHRSFFLQSLKTSG